MLERQFQFSKMLGQLFYWMAQEEYKWSLGRAYESSDKLPCPHCGREYSQQEILVYNKRSKTLNSKHLDRLAVDINLFDADNKLASSIDFLPIGEKWESLGGKWGGRFKPLGASGIGWDPGHLEL
jgi:hypothetical protein